MNAEEVWRQKDDASVVRGLNALADYTDDGQQIIRAEAARRGLDASTPVAPDGPPDTFPIESTDPPARNPFTRLWRGEWSLPITFWVWGMCSLWIAVPVVMVAVGAMVPVIGGLPGVVLGMSAVVCIFAWQIVVWIAIVRSAARYQGSVVWRRMAQVMVAGSAMRQIMQLVMHFAPASGG